MWSDKETLHDFLGFSTYVEVLADICTQSDLAPLTLGIFGPWGSGKTSLMQMVENRLSAHTHTGTGAIKTIWFNAWRYEGRDEAQSALIHAIISKLEEDKTLGEDVLDTLKQLKSSANVLKLAKAITKSALTLSPDVDGFFSAFEKQNEKILNVNQMIRAGGLLLRIAERDLLRMLKNEGLPQHPSVLGMSVGLATPTLTFPS